MAQLFRFHNSGLEGAGFNNVIAINPFDTNRLVIGCDVAGFHYSSARGGGWVTGNRGLSSLSQIKVASLLFSPTVAGKLYAATGNKGVGGGLLVSLDNGRSWEVRSTTPQFSGGNTGTSFPLPSPHPRSTGNLIVQDSSGRIYVGTFNQGVMRSDDDGTTWPVTVTFGSGDTYVRSIVLDPSDPTKLYVGTYSKQAWRIDGVNGLTPTTTLLTNAPADVEEFFTIGSNLYAACGGYGIYSVTSQGAVWTTLNNGIDLTTSKWISGTGYFNGTADTIYVGCAYPFKIPQGGGIAYAKSIMMSTDSGANWSAITLDPSKVHTNIIGEDGKPSTKQWWLPQTVSSILIHRNTYVAASIVIDPTNHQRLYVAGRSGAWRSDDGGVNWYPIVQGLAVTINRAVIPEYSTPSKIWIASTDWVIIKSQDYASSVIQDRPGPNTGYDLFYDRLSSRVYAAFGHRDINQNGKIFSKLYADTKWTDERIDVPPGVTTLEDAFGRTVSGGWGTPDYGPAYTHNNPSAFSTNGTYGVIQLTGSNQNYSASSAVNLQDLTSYCEVSWDNLSVVAATQAELTVRQTAINNFYGFRIRNTTDGNISLVIRKVVAGTSTTLGNKLGAILSYTVGDVAYMRINCYGTNPTNLMAKIWVDGEDEPDSWLVTITDSEPTLQTSGAVSVRAISDASYALTTHYSYRRVEFVQHGVGGSGGRRPFGVAVGRDGSNNVVILAAVEESGIWRRVGAGAWSLVGAPAMSGSQLSKAAVFSWPHATPYVFLYDRATGVWRSTNYGANWTQIWASPSDQEMTGYVAASPSDPSILWVSKLNSLYKLTNAIAGTSVGTDITATLVSEVSRAGALTIGHDDAIYCTSKVGTGLALGEDPALFVSRDGGATWNNIADRTYASVANYPYRIAVATDGRLYLSLNGNGVMVGEPVSSNVKAWDGSVWQFGVPRVWDGVSWKPHLLKYWDGSQWK